MTSIATRKPCGKPPLSGGVVTSTFGTRASSCRIVAPLTLALALAAAVGLAGCASSDTTRSGLLEPYRTDLPQGNYVTREMLDRVSLGMSKAEVRRALGSPLLTDVFLPDRWNYVFSYRHRNGRVDLRRVIVQFNAQERVSLIEADQLPEVEAPSDPALPGFRPEAFDRAG